MVLISIFNLPYFQLARYLNRTYWEKKQEEVRKSPTPSAPAPVSLAEPVPVSQPVESHAPVQPINIVEVHGALKLTNPEQNIFQFFSLTFSCRFLSSSIRTENRRRTTNSSWRLCRMPSPPSSTAWRATTCAAAASPTTALCSLSSSPSTTCTRSCWRFSTNSMRKDVSQLLLMLIFQIMYCIAYCETMC